MKIADIHAHIFPERLAAKASDSIGSFYGASTSHVASLEILLEQEALAGIGYTAVSSSATSPEQAAHINDFISGCARERPNLVPLGSLFPGMDGWEAELERMQALGIRGIKIHPDFQRVNIDEPKAVEMYRAIARAGLPVLFHMGDARYDYSSPERLANLIRQVPDLVAIAAHFGGWQSWDRSYAHVLPENVYYDTSSSLMYLGKELSGQAESQSLSLRQRLPHVVAPDGAGTVSGTGAGGEHPGPHSLRQFRNTLFALGGRLDG